MRVDPFGDPALTRAMNVFRGIDGVVAIIAVALVAGCSTPKSEPSYTDVPGASAPVIAGDTAEIPTPAVQAVDVAAPVAEPVVQPLAQDDVETPKPELIVTPDDMLTGSVVAVNDVGRFVVLTFPLGRMPSEGATVFAYRQGLKVAELKVTGPQKDDHTVADIQSGDCRVKDEVRDR